MMEIIMQDKHAVLQKIKDIRLLAVIRGPSKDMTLKIVEALVAGGVVGIEITYSTPNAEVVVAALRDTFGDDILLGMGTLTEPEQAESAKVAGAEFIVSPMCEPTLVKAMVASGLVTMAGALTPTEIFQAYRLGSDVVKVFPGSIAGPKYIKDIHGPFPYIDLMPTGGVSKENIPDWFAAGVIAVGVGSALCPKHLALEGRFAEISKRAAEFVKIVNQSKA
jgi:2-dehydro-3-deoxyphosphogluconate aldolase / (4S)-4-hydroxy-2-oxoglutarate aldolase